MSDLISRRAAINKTKELFSMGECYCDKFSIIGMLNSLPSAESEIKDQLDSAYAHGYTEAEAHFYKALQSRPEIIRCRDCKFYTPMNRKTKTGICNLTLHQNFGDDWFCAGAERRYDETD